MPEVKVTTGTVAIIQVSDASLAKKIYDKLGPLADKHTAIEFRRAKQQIALVFSDKGEIGIGVQDYQAELEKVEDVGGKFLVYASDPSIGAEDSGGPVIPPPDMLCPCGGP